VGWTAKWTLNSNIWSKMSCLPEINLDTRTDQRGSNKYRCQDTNEMPTRSGVNFYTTVPTQESKDQETFLDDVPDDVSDTSTEIQSNTIFNGFFEGQDLEELMNTINHIPPNDLHVFQQLLLEEELT